MILINGAPKTGTHKLAAMLLDKDIRHDPSLPADIIRHPRNVLISRVRAFGRSVLREIPHMLRESQYIPSSNVYQFEDIPIQPTTATWTGRHSVWREWWTPEIDKAWGEAGRELEALWGYR